MLSYGAISEPKIKIHFSHKLRYESVFLHPHHLEHVASKVIMEEKAGGYAGIFFRAITSVYIS